MIRAVYLADAVVAHDSASAAKANKERIVAIAGVCLCRIGHHRHIFRDRAGANPNNVWEKGVVVPPFPLVCHSAE